MKAWFYWPIDSSMSRSVAFGRFPGNMGFHLRTSPITVFRRSSPAGTSEASRTKPLEQLCKRCAKYVPSRKVQSKWSTWAEFPGATGSWTHRYPQLGRRRWEYSQDGGSRKTVQYFSKKKARDIRELVSYRLKTIRYVRGLFQVPLRSLHSRCWCFQVCPSVP